MSKIAIEWQADGKTLRKTVNSMQSISIGRHPNCDIVLGDTHVSRRHAAIYFSEGAFHLHNKSTTNPILFNEQWPIAHNLKSDLQIGDSFIIGQVKLKVVLPSAVHSGTGDIADGNLRSRCPSCNHLMDYGQADCSWCGTSLAEAEKVVLKRVISFMDQ